MPISPEKQKLYPGGSINSSEWKAIRSRILERDGNACKFCGVKNYALGGRTRDGIFHAALPVGERRGHLEWPEPGERYWCVGASEQLRIIRIVLTVAHLNHDTTQNDDDNLAALCQADHLRYDAKLHAANARATAIRKSGQRDLLEG